MDTTMFCDRIPAAWIACLAVAFVVPALNCNAQESETTVTCVNPVSGTSWQIVIDYGKPRSISIPPRLHERESPGSTPKTAATINLTGIPVILPQVLHRAPAAFFDMVIAVWRNRGDG
jgi:hypothetical protein